MNTNKKQTEAISIAVQACLHTSNFHILPAPTYAFFTKIQHIQHIKYQIEQQQEQAINT